MGKVERRYSPFSYNDFQFKFYPVKTETAEKKNKQK